MASITSPGTAGFGQYRVDQATGEVYYDPQGNGGGWPEGTTETRAKVLVRDSTGALAVASAIVDVTKTASAPLPQQLVASYGSGVWFNAKRSDFYADLAETTPAGVGDYAHVFKASDGSGHRLRDYGGLEPNRGQIQSNYFQTFAGGNGDVFYLERTGSTPVPVPLHPNSGGDSNWFVSICMIQPKRQIVLSAGFTWDVRPAASPNTEYLAFVDSSEANYFVGDDRTGNVVTQVKSVSGVLYMRTSAGSWTLQGDCESAYPGPLAVNGNIVPSFSASVNPTAQRITDLTFIGGSVSDADADALRAWQLGDI